MKFEYLIRRRAIKGYEYMSLRFDANAGRWQHEWGHLDKATYWSTEVEAGEHRIQDSEVVHRDKVEA